MRIARFLFPLLSSVASGWAHAPIGASATFAHDPLTCMSTDQFPIVEAELDPAESRALRLAQVYFKASRTTAWYVVEMEPGEGSRFRAMLPRPLLETDRVDYYLFFLSNSFEPAQSEEFSVSVTDTGCGAKTRAAPTSVSLTLRATTANQPYLPPGFNAQGISSFVTAAGNTVTIELSADRHYAVQHNAFPEPRRGNGPPGPLDGEERRRPRSHLRTPAAGEDPSPA